MLFPIIKYILFMCILNIVNKNRLIYYHFHLFDILLEINKRNGEYLCIYLLREGIFVFKSTGILPWLFKTVTNLVSETLFIIILAQKSISMYFFDLRINELYIITIEFNIFIKSKFVFIFSVIDILKLSLLSQAKCILLRGKLLNFKLPEWRWQIWFESSFEQNVVHIINY